MKDAFGGGNNNNLGGFGGMPNINLPRPLIIAIVVILILVLGFSRSFQVIDARERGIVRYLGKLSEDKNVAIPRNSLLAGLRSIFRFFPIHKIYHSVELSIIILISAIFDVSAQVLVLLTLAALITVVGHLVAILTSSRLRA